MSNNIRAAATEFHRRSGRKAVEGSSWSGAFPRLIGPENAGRIDDRGIWDRGDPRTHPCSCIFIIGVPLPPARPVESGRGMASGSTVIAGRLRCRICWSIAFNGSVFQTSAFSSQPRRATEIPYSRSSKPADGMGVGIDHDRHPLLAGPPAVDGIEVEPMRIGVDLDHRAGLRRPRR